MLAKTQFKLGLFTLTALAALLATALALGWRGARRTTVRYVTYFDESVQGLDLGAPVKFRGVGIGTVSDIAIAPDRRHVAVGLALERGDARRLDAAGGELRAQLATQGVTGVRFVDIDYPHTATPPPVLPFAVGPHTIPSRPSLLGGLELDVQVIARDLPALIERSGTTLGKIDRVFDELHDEQVAKRVASLVDNLDATVRDARAWVAELRRARVPAEAAATLTRAREATAKLAAVLDKLDRADALIASATRASDAVGDLGRSARDSRAELDRTVRELGDAARAFRDLVEELERQPDMLVTGRAKPRSR